MNWKEQLTKIESQFGTRVRTDWNSDIALIDDLMLRHPENVELNIRAIYILHNILVEEEYADSEEARMIKLLQRWFSSSKDRFSDNPEYMFFIGKILHIAWWYFGLDNNQLALAFQEKAMYKEPGNLLYEWAYRLSCPGDTLEGYLAHQLITNEPDKIAWLKAKGFPGEYVVEHLKMSNKEYLERKDLL